MTGDPIHAQVEAIESLIKIVKGVSRPPRASEKDMLVDRARQGVETLKRIAASAGGRL